MVIVEIDLDSVRSENYSKNEKKCGLYEPCLICGKPIKQPTIAKHVQLLTNGKIVSCHEPFDNTQGLFPVGNDCAKTLTIHFAH